MDSGPVGLSDMFVGSNTGGLVSDPETKKRRYGSGVGFLKQERDNNNVNEDDEWIIRSSKLVKTSSDDDFSVPNKIITTAMLRNSTTNNINNGTLRSSTSNSTLFHDVTQPQQMLCFSTPKSESLAFSSSQTLATFPYHNYQPSFPSNYTGLNSGSLNGSSMQGVLSGARGPFTPSQRIELEHQALIFNYISSDVPVPSNLLLPIKKAFDSAGFSYYPGGFLRPTSFGWGSFHLGFSNTNDPEPGRCRRTDGKKWRCSRDAVADQKYCERHMNRGRHRSRKPVEGQTGHPVTGATTSTTTKQMPVSSSASASVAPSGGANSSLSIAHQQLKNLQSGVLNLSGDASANRFFMTKNNVGEKMQNLPGLCVVSPTIDLKSKENAFSMMRQQMPSEDSSQQKFGLDTSCSLLTASHKASALLSSRNFGSSQDLGDRQTESHSSIHQFMDTWPGDVADRSALSWPEVNMQQERAHLSISIPMTSSEFISSTSPNNDRAVLSPLRLSREFDQTQMNLGVGGGFSESIPKQTNGVSISWGSSMGGPLAEVLHNTSNGTTDCKNSSMLNLMTDGWDNSPPIGSSPTGVLQKPSFASLSNSSAGSSPRAEINRTHEGSNLSSNLLGSTLANSSSLPDL